MKPPLVYHYHPDIHIYLGSSEADESPLEPGVFLIPAHASFTPPASDIAESQINVWDISNGVWTIQDKVDPPNDKLPPVREEIPNAISQLRKLRDARLQEVDWVAIKYFTLGLPYPTDWATYVQALRDLPATSEDKLVVDEQGRLLDTLVAWPTQPTFQ